VLEDLAVQESPTPHDASDTEHDDTRDEKEAS
jgi:hypothetical protein